MNQSIQQFKAVFRKGFLGQTEQKSLIVNVGIPLFCGLSTYLPYVSSFMLGWTVVLQFFYFPMALAGFFRNMIMAIVVEKQDKLKENQFIMGLKPIPYYFGWFSFIFAFSTFLQFFYLIPAYYGYEIRDSLQENFFYVLIEYTFYLFSLTGQMLLVSCFFTDGRKANEFYGLFSLLLGCGVFLSSFLYEYTTLVFSLFPQTLLFASIPGLTLEYFTLSYGQILGVQFLQGVIQFTLYIYIDQIMPNDMGNQKNILFFLKCLFKTNQNQVLIEEQYDIQLPQANLQTGLMNVVNVNYGINYEQQEAQEYNPESVLVSMDQVCKYYDGKAVVNKLTLNLNENEIFCLLGHNGAGKSTTINILTGMIKKASGKITICGLNLDDDIDQIRNLIGYCSQKDVLYPRMNVYEQIKYYAQIKLVPDNEIHDHVMTIIQKCHLEQEKTQLAMYLSGGGKRKLCLAISLVGNSKVIFLDEPTSGLDPLARQQIWGILKEIKKHRCIILTTHYLDEAQELADNVGIIQEGSLIVSGTVEQIKRRFSVGYHLTLECKDEDQTSRIKLDVEKILHQITDQPIQCIQQNTILRTIIPQEFQKKIGGIFRELEEFPQTKLSFEMNTLEDAYINIHLNFPGVNQQVFPVRNDNNNLINDVKPIYSFSSQFYAIILKKYYIQMQNKWMLISIFAAWIVLIVIYKLIAGSMEKNNPIIMLFYFVIIKTMLQSNYTYVPIYERQTKIKETQIIMGMKVVVYWLGTLIYDMLPIVLETIWYVILLYLFFDMNSLNMVINQIVILNFAFMVALNCFSYAISLLFDSTRKAYIYIPLLLFLSQIIGAILQVIVYVISESMRSDLVGLIIPYYALYNGYTLILLKTSNFLPIQVLYLTLSGSIYFGITILYEFRKYNIYPDNPQVGAIQVNDLTKVYGKKLVVKGINFEVQEKQIFGLLGPNGAGKTTTFNMLSKFDKPTAGTVKIKNQQNEIGVIPQFSPLYNELTLVEHLWIYGLIKGMSEVQIEQFIDQFCLTLNMEGVKNKQVKFLSGGERRKSQLAICLIGGSSKLFLDEPSSGLDPVSRQSLQEVLLRNCQENGSSTVITTHSMQEAQRICEVIGIMVNGKFICKGSLGELRDMFGNAYRVSIKLQSEEYEDAANQLFQKELLANNIETLDEVRKNYITYKVNSQNIKISQLFSLCESEKMQKLISDYSIYQISLEQIFQYFANQQEAVQIADDNDPRDQANCFCIRLVFAPCCLN